MTVRVLTSDPRGWPTLELLDAYTPADAREHAHRDAMLGLLATTSAPFSRSQADPGHFTASALVVTADRRAVLLIEHPTLGLWLQPGGHIEPGDRHPQLGAAREVLEETGMHATWGDALFDVDVHEIPARGGMPAHRHFDLRFLATVEATIPPHGAEGVRAEWLSRPDALARTSDESVRRMIAKLGPEPGPGVTA